MLRAVRTCRNELKQIAGVHVEGPFISRKRAGAQRPEFIRNPEPQVVQQLLEYADVIQRVTLAPELPGALEAIDRLRAQNIAVSGGHSDAWDEEARDAFEHGMRQVTHTFNCMSSMHRRNGERVAGLLEFALSEPEIMCELIADGHHVSNTLMKMLYRAKGSKGICLVTDATAGAGLPEGATFTLAGADCMVSGGACWLADRSALAGSAARMIDLVRTMVRQVGVPLPEAIAMASANPSRALRTIDQRQTGSGRRCGFRGVVGGVGSRRRRSSRVNGVYAKSRERATAGQGGAVTNRPVAPATRTLRRLVSRASVEAPDQLTAKEEISRYRGTRSAGRAG